MLGIVDILADVAAPLFVALCVVYATHALATYEKKKSKPAL